MYLDDDFYAQLKSFKSFSQFTQLKAYKRLPEEWFVVVADIQNSTDAITKGLYKEVNSISTATVASVLNAVAPLSVPFVFGGDGATFCIPLSKKEATQSALIAVKKLARESFGLHLRVGLVPMRHIRNEGCEVLIGKYQPTDHFKQAMFQGNGLGYAESLIKNESHNALYCLDEAHVVPKANFQGFECRWNEILSPHEETVSIIIQVIDGDNEHKKRMYQRISEEIIKIYGDEKKHHPLRTEKLKLTLSTNKLSSEARIRTAFLGTFARIKYTSSLLFLSLAGKYLMAKKIRSDTTDWGEYKQRLIQNTDYRKFDEMLRMVISGTQAQRERLVAFLEMLHVEKTIIFGVHASPAAIITCMVFNYDTEHIHFLDGSNGGYAMAAIAMKKQAKSLKTNKTAKIH